MEYRRVAVVYNPAAGKRRVARVKEAIEVVRRWVRGVEVLETRGPGGAVERAREACRAGVDLVLACGGDGTLHEVINGVAPGETAVGVLPAGTANVVALDMGLPRDPVRAAEQIPDLVARRVALGRLICRDAPPRYFALACGAGVDAELMYRTPAAAKKRLGMTAYWLAGFRMLGRRLEVLQASVDGRPRPCTLALVTRVREIGGGLRVARRSHLLDHEMEVALFPSRSTLRYVVYMTAALAGRLAWCTDVTMLRAARVELDGSARVEADGEYAGRLPATVDAARDALTLLMPRRFADSGG